MEELPSQTLNFLIYITFTHTVTKIQDNAISFENDVLYSEHYCTQETCKTSQIQSHFHFFTYGGTTFSNIKNAHKHNF